MAHLVQGFQNTELTGLIEWKARLNVTYAILHFPGEETGPEKGIAFCSITALGQGPLCASLLLYLGSLSPFAG